MEDFKAAIAKLENADELFEYHSQSVEAERTRGIEAKRKANREAEGLRAYKKAMEALGYNPEEHTDLNDYIETLKAFKQAGPQGSDTEISKQLKKLQRDLERTVTELNSEKQAKAEIETKAKVSSLKSTLAKPFSERFFASDFIVDGLIGNGTVDMEDGQVVFKDGDRVLSFEEGVKWAESKFSDSRRNTQKPGAGTPPATGGSGSGRLYTKDELNKMKPDEINANWQDVQKSLTAIAN